MIVGNVLETNSLIVAHHNGKQRNYLKILRIVSFHLPLFSFTELLSYNYQSTNLSHLILQVDIQHLMRIKVMSNGWEDNISSNLLWGVRGVKYRPLPGCHLWSPTSQGVNGSHPEVWSPGVNCTDPPTDHSGERTVPATRAAAPCRS